MYFIFIAKVTILLYIKVFYRLNIEIKVHILDNVMCKGPKIKRWGLAP
jgi:hypothetical protein